MVSVLDSEKPEQAENNEISVENFLERLGGYSRFQLLATIFIIAPEISAAMVALSPIFTGSSHVHFICDTENGTYKIYADVLCDIGCNGTLRPTSVHSSIVQEWDLFCNHSWMTDLLTSIQMLGSMVGAISAAQLADRFGRKTAFFSMCFLMGSFGSVSGFAVEPYSYSFARFMAGFAVGGCFVVYLNYLMEFLTPAYRTICGCVSLWAVGEMLLALAGYLLPEWHYLTIATSVPVFTIFLAYPFLPESPRWLLCHKRTDEAVDVFNRIAKWNGRKPIEPEEIKKLQAVITFEAESVKKSKKSRLVQSLTLLRIPKIRNQLIALMFAWFSSALVYYGISFNMKNLSGDPYLNVLYMGVLDLPGSFSGILFNNAFGRRKTFLGFLAVGSVFLLALLVVAVTRLGIDYPHFITTLCLMGRYCHAAGFAVMACFTAESFPTVGRVTCMGLCALAGNFGGLLAPQIAYLGTITVYGHYIAFCVFTIGAATGALLMNDMKGKPLEDNLQDTE